MPPCSCAAFVSASGLPLRRPRSPLLPSGLSPQRSKGRPEYAGSLRRAAPQALLGDGSKRSSRGTMSAAAALAAAVIAVTSVAPAALPFAEPPSARAPVRTDAERQVIELFQNATRSVVNVTTFSAGRQGLNMNQTEMPVGAGSGIVWDKKGRIVTNFHVIQNASGAKITLANKKSYDAKLKGYDADKDIAVLEIDAPAKELAPIALGSSSSLSVGQSTYAIGNPFGLDHTLTSGVLSGLGRDMKSPTGRIISNCIQTDASTNPGNSGGPLLQSNGELIGINTSIYSPSGASAGVGFAIPVDTIKQIVDSLIENGHIVRPVLGISYLESSQARSLGIDRGVLVLSVVPGSSAEKAGIIGTRRAAGFGSLELGDIVTAIDGEDIKNEADLFRILEGHDVGDRVKVSVVNPRDGERLLGVKLGSSAS